MTETQKPTDRLAYTDNLEPLIGRVAEVYGIGTPTSHSVVEVGYEDCNVIIERRMAIFSQQGAYQNAGFVLGLLYIIY